MPMKALTLHQPWASLIALGAKKIETRGWYTAYRGPLAIHAGLNKTYIKGLGSFLDVEPFRSVLGSSRFGLPLGAIVATCELVHVKQISDVISFLACREFWWQKRCWHLNEQERAFGNYAIGRYMWLLDNVVVLPEPIPAKGAQGLWTWDGAECLIP